MSIRYARCLALAVPCALAAVALAPPPALAISPPDARAVCFATGGLVPGRFENVRACNKTAGVLGDYRVTIGSPVGGCTFVATLGRAGAGSLPPPGEIGVSQGGAANVVRVQTRNSAGAPADLPFHLVVAC